MMTTSRSLAIAGTALLGLIVVAVTMEWFPRVEESGLSGIRGSSNHWISSDAKARLIEPVDSDLERSVSEVGSANQPAALQNEPEAIVDSRADWGKNEYRLFFIGKYEDLLERATSKEDRIAAALWLAQISVAAIQDEQGLANQSAQGPRNSGDQYGFNLNGDTYSFDKSAFPEYVEVWAIKEQSLRPRREGEEGLDFDQNTISLLHVRADQARAALHSMGVKNVR